MASRMSVEHTVPAGSGLRPELHELVGLRTLVQAWPPQRRASSGAAPMVHSPLRGRGMEYAESRPYLPGDDARHIDWRVTARTGRTHSKLFHSERERTTLLLCDTAPALFFGTRVRFKSVQAARAAALAAWAARRGGDRIAALRGNVAEPLVSPAGGERGVARVLHALCRWYAQAPAEDEGLVPALRAATRLLRPGSRLVLVADPRSLYALPDGLLARLSLHNDVLCILLADPIELSPPSRRLPLLFAGHRRDVDFAEASVRRAWDASHAGRIAALRDVLGRQRVANMLLRADDPSEAVLPWLLSARPEAA